MEKTIVKEHFAEEPLLHSNLLLLHLSGQLEEAKLTTWKRTYEGRHKQCAGPSFLSHLTAFLN